MTEESTSGKSWRPRRVSWLTIVLALLAIGTFFAISRPDMRYVVPMMGFGSSSGGVGMMETSGNYTMAVPPSAGMPMRDMNASIQGPDMKGGMYYPYPYYGGEVPVSDTREFLKVNYNASMRTRDVPGLTRTVETTVRGHEGRIDQESSSPEYGYVSFAVPISTYDAFRTELEGLVGSRFLTLNISSQNLLPQKQSIEEQQKQADSTLADYKAARQKLVNAHASSVKSLQAQIDADVQELATLRAQTSTSQIQARIEAVSEDLSWSKQKLGYENSAYGVVLKDADANIKYAQDWQKAVETQDKTLLDNVATVTGSVSIQWISFWEMAQLYLPGYWIPTIFAILAFLSFLYDRRRFGTV